MIPAMTKNKSTRGRPFGMDRIFGKDEESDTPYMTRFWIGRLRLHIFHRGDRDPDCHDHPWSFWTFPLTPYLEEVADAERDLTRVKLVRAWRWHYRDATHCHRVLGPWHGRVTDAGWLRAANANYPLNGRIITFVWRGPECREWGFLKRRGGRWCWVPHTEYVFGAGKVTPCP